jgi:hypothetical protein
MHEASRLAPRHGPHRVVVGDGQHAERAARSSASIPAQDPPGEIAGPALVGSRVPKNGTWRRPEWTNRQVRERGKRVGRPR